MKRRDHPRQLTFAWTAAAVATAEPPTPVAAPVVEPEPPPAVADASESEMSPLLQVLPWDFSTTYPPVLEEALDAGIVEDEDAEPEGLAALHAEHARELLAALSGLDGMQDARRRGVDPATGKAPRTLATQQKLSEKLDREIARLERWWETLLGTYEEAFGAMAAEAFGHCVRARHAGIEVMAIAEPLACITPDLPAPKPLPESVRPVRPVRSPPELPNPRPLRRSVKAGVFGQDEQGSPVDPDADEVREITEHHAEIVTELVTKFHEAGRPARAHPPAGEVRDAVQKYAADFGQRAADSLLAYCRRQASLNDSATPPACRP